MNLILRKSGASALRGLSFLLIVAFTLVVPPESLAGPGNSATHQPLESDLAITASRSVVYVTELLDGSAALTINVTNYGPDDLASVIVAIDLPLSDWLSELSNSTSKGTVNGAGDAWDIGALVSGESALLTVEGLVLSDWPADLTFSTSAADDPNAYNDVATIELSMGFNLPPKTQVNTADFAPRTVLEATANITYDQLVIGIFQGSPGIEGAVWCLIPSELPGVWPLGAGLDPDNFVNRWRPCADGLPFPLHPNELFYDEATGSLWVTTWGWEGLYRSDDSGQTWVGVEPDLGEFSNGTTGWVLVHAITKDTAGFIYISANDGYVVRSGDNGANWQIVGSLPNVDADTPWSLEAHPEKPGVIYAGTFGRGVFVSFDYGWTWDYLDDGSGTSNDALLDLDESLDDQAGHIFDLNVGPESIACASPTCYTLFAATGRGVWRVILEGDTGAILSGESWENMGPDVTYQVNETATETVYPETRSLVFVEDAGGEDDLVVGTWGFGAFVFNNPMTTTGFAEIILRGAQVTAVAAASDGSLFLGTSDGESVITTTADSRVITTFSEAAGDLPAGYSLDQNYPNPFNPVTTISYQLPEAGQVRLAVYDMLGREVAVLVDAMGAAGSYRVQFDGSNLASGTYPYRLETPGGILTRSLLLLQ